MSQGAVKVPATRVIKLVRMTCPDGKCQIVRAVPSLKVNGRQYNVSSRFSREKIGSGKQLVIKVAIPKRAWQNLRQGIKSGSVIVNVTARSSNKSRVTESFRFGLTR